MHKHDQWLHQHFVAKQNAGEGNDFNRYYLWFKFAIQMKHKRQFERVSVFFSLACAHTQTQLRIDTRWGEEMESAQQNAHKEITTFVYLKGEIGMIETAFCIAIIFNWLKRFKKL